MATFLHSTLRHSFNSFFLNRKGRKGKADYELYVMSYKLIGNENQQPTTENH